MPRPSGGTLPTSRFSCPSRTWAPESQYRDHTRAFSVQPEVVKATQHHCYALNQSQSAGRANSRQAPAHLPVPRHPATPSCPCSQPALLQSLQAQHASHPILHLLLVFGPLVAPHDGSLHVGRAFAVGLGQHAHDRDQYLLDGLNGAPSLRSVLVMVRVVTRGVQDRNTDEAVGIDCCEAPEVSIAIPPSSADPDSPLGWKISPRNFIVGGARG